jgi:dipicolinate synthase subunit B
MSEASSSIDTRFGKASEHIDFLEKTSNCTVIKSIKDAEPIGPKKLLDVLVVAPCTGNTLAKIANGIADSTVTLAVKSHLRNKRPVVIGVSTNDGLGNNAKSIGNLLNAKNIYFVPFSQDDCNEKENSLVANMELIIPSVEKALDGLQLQPLILINK